MERTHHTPEQIIEILHVIAAERANGKSIAQCCKEASIGEWTCYRWRKQYQGMSKSNAKCLKELERENAHLKKLLAEKTDGLTLHGVCEATFTSSLRPF